MSTQHDNKVRLHQLEKAIHDLIREFDYPPVAVMLKDDNYKRHSLQDLPCSEHEFNSVLAEQNNKEGLKIEITQLQHFKNKHSL